jgi:hypothetical protein
VALSQPDAIAKMVDVSGGYDLPPFPKLLLIRPSLS